MTQADLEVNEPQTKEFPPVKHKLSDLHVKFIKHLGENGAVVACGALDKELLEPGCALLRLFRFFTPFTCLFAHNSLSQFEVQWNNLANEVRLPKIEVK